MSSPSHRLSLTTVLRKRCKTPKKSGSFQQLLQTQSLAAPLTNLNLRFALFRRALRGVLIGFLFFYCGDALVNAGQLMGESWCAAHTHALCRRRRLLRCRRRRYPPPLQAPRGNAAGDAHYHYSQPMASKRSASPSFNQCSKRTVLSLFTEMFEARLTQGALPPLPPPKSLALALPHLSTHARSLLLFLKLLPSAALLKKLVDAIKARPSPPPHLQSTQPPTEASNQTQNPYSIRPHRMTML